jgi:excisionase family DNA binding protein
MKKHASSASTRQPALRRLQREVAELRARLDAMPGASGHGAQPSRHSPEKLTWAKKYSIDLDNFEPLDASPVGTHTMNVAEAARALGLSLEQVRRHLRSGHLRGTALGGRAGWRVSRADVERFRVTREALNAGRSDRRLSSSGRHRGRVG